MASYAALVSVVQLLEEIIIHDQNFFVFNNKQVIIIIKTLHEKFTLLQKSLDDDLSSNEDEASDNLARRIRDAAYQAQDIIESQLISNHHDHIIHPEEEGGVDMDVCPESQNDGNICQEEEDLKKVEEDVDFILEEMKRIKTMSLERSNRSEVLQPRDQHDSSAADIGGRSTSIMMGYDDHLDTLKKLLEERYSRRQIIPIVGPGGIGKTLLARYIFDDNDVKDHFDILVWVTVTHNYHIRNLLQMILNSLDMVKRQYDHMSNRELEVIIYRSLLGKRYLIIMDDIWSTAVWDDLRRILTDNRNRSRIILTTRFSNVARYFARHPSLEMKFLNEEQSWNLFREKVFGQEEDCPDELEDIGKSIANSCGGLPLAIVVAAGVLSKIPRTQYDWEHFAISANSIMRSSDERLGRLLSVSYNTLPHHLKLWFLYIGVFPDKYEISVSRLIKLWVAEGFLKPISGKSLEEVGEMYVQDLVDRNLFLITKKRVDGKIKVCGMHNLLRELCREKINQEEFFHLSNENGDIFPGGLKNARRSCLYSSDTVSISCHVRSVLCFEHPQNLLSVILSFKRLRALDALGMVFTAFPLQLLKLFNLRYLAFRVNTIRYIKLPTSISKLHHLQTLIIDGFISLPPQIWMMLQLRHIQISIINLSPFDATIGGCKVVQALRNLQTLWTVENFIFVYEAIKMIPNLRKLKLRCTESKSDSTWLQYRLKNLIFYQKLETLDITFLVSNEQNDKSVVSFPESFAFPQNLKKLSLSGCCKLPWKDITALDSFHYLVTLKLLRNAVVGEEWRTFEGEFQSLSFLVLEDLDLKYWRADDSTHFPRLVHLEIRHCKNLEKIPLEFGDISRLKLIKVCSSSRSASDSAMLIQQQQQQSYGNYDLEVLVQHK